MRTWSLLSHVMMHYDREHRLWNSFEIRRRPVAPSCHINHTFTLHQTRVSSSIVDVLSCPVVAQFHLLASPRIVSATADLDFLIRAQHQRQEQISFIHSESTRHASLMHYTHERDKRWLLSHARSNSTFILFPFHVSGARPRFVLVVFYRAFFFSPFHFRASTFGA